MNQEKIGKFIAERRKSKKLTQEELAWRLGVSNKSVSRWENGKSMPDYSMFEPLSKELDISINELMCGEKVDEEKYQEKFEENVVNSMASIERKSRRWSSLIIGVIFLVVIFIGSMILLNTIQVKLKYDEDRMYVMYHPEYGIRYINKNSCTIYQGNISYVVKDIDMDGEKIKAIFVVASCSISDIYKYNLEGNGLSQRIQNFEIFDKDWQEKYRIYYTRDDLEKIKRLDDKNELREIISNAQLVRVSKEE